MFAEHYRFAFIVLIIGNVISTIFAYESGIDGRAWWPLYFILVLTLTLTYAFVFSFVASWKMFSILPAWYVHAGLSVVNVLLLPFSISVFVPLAVHTIALIIAIRVGMISS